MRWAGLRTRAQSGSGPLSSVIALALGAEVNVRQGRKTLSRVLPPLHRHLRRHALVQHWIAKHADALEQMLPPRSRAARYRVPPSGADEIVCEPARDGSEVSTFRGSQWAWPRQTVRVRCNGPLPHSPHRAAGPHELRHRLRTAACDLVRAQEESVQRVVAGEGGG